ncbi:MAG TPA: DUF2267 domain-containing protein [Acetobacteraceae bacterium]|nr:DUF2267 domain-containing protein [Acetobacteraceae bacterium]
MSTTGLEVFDRTLHLTNIWLDEVMEAVGPDRKLAWHVLCAVLRTLRDRLPPELAAHLAAQLPLLVRGAYYERFQVDHRPVAIDSEAAFLDHVAAQLEGTRPINLRKATGIVLRVLQEHVAPGMTEKLKHALPHDIRALWPAEAALHP